MILQMETLAFSLAIPEKVSLNKIYAGSHWRTRKRLADIYHDTIKNHIPDGTVYGGTFPINISLTFDFSSRALDASNCVYMGKMLEDGLVRAGVIPDDSPKYVRGFSVTSKKVKADEDMVHIRIEACPT